MHNIKNTVSLRNVKVKGMKKRKVIKSSQKEASIEVSTSKCYDAISKEMQVKRLRERIKFAVNQLRLAISEQKEAINHSLIYIWRACNKRIENSIQKQINLLQSQTNNKLEIILQLMQQNTQNIEKRINLKQMTGNLQILQVKQISQMSQDMQTLQRSTQKLTYAQKTAQFAEMNANAKTNSNANADEWNLIIKKLLSKS